jgi:hypothetical protein
MNKILLSPGHFPTRIVLIFALGVLVCGTSIQPARADAGPGPDPTVGGAGPYQPLKTNVQMLSETVLIDVPSFIDDMHNQISVFASFNMQNQGSSEEKMQVVFPLTRLNNLPWGEESYYHVDNTSFMVWVDGQRVPITEISTPAEKGYQLEYDGGSASPTGGFDPDVRWAAFDVTFPSHQTVALQVEYKMISSYTGFMGIEYILETGAGWYGRILSADIVLRLPYAATQELVEEANPGYVFSGNELRWKFIDFEPTREDNLSVWVITPEAWQTVLDLRSRVAQNPRDADAWFKLGEECQQLAIDNPHFNYFIHSRHFADLSIESYEKAIGLRPDWGEAHYALASILWRSNPLVAKRFTGYTDKGKSDVPLSDPSIQRVLQELKLAWSYGAIHNENYEFSFVSRINAAIPGLHLTPPATLTFTPKPATQTPTSTPVKPITPANTPRPAPSAVPSAVPTPAPAQNSSTNAVGGVIIGMLIVLVVLVYSRRSKFGDRR